MFSAGAIFALVVSVILGSLFTPLSSNDLFVSQNQGDPYVQAKNILLVTAHPDDEAMFFAPTLLQLAPKSAEGSISLYHLCMSTGNAEGLGQTRKLELSNSLNILGVPQQKRWVINHPELQDNITANWDVDVIAKAIKPYVTELKIDTILTFDNKGVSDHPNHKALPAGVQALIKTFGETSSKPRLFTLFSAPLLTKYTSLVTVSMGKVDVYVYEFMTWLEQRIILVLSHWYPEILTPKVPRHRDAGAMPVFLLGYEDYSTALLAMRAHESQMLWFRWLYVAFSRYMWGNAWTHVQV